MEAHLPTFAGQGLHQWPGQAYSWKRTRFGELEAQFWSGFLKGCWHDPVAAFGCNSWCRSSATGFKALEDFLVILL
eukprot:3020646-Prorocentrum_lima.AAC.1